MRTLISSSVARGVAGLGAVPLLEEAIKTSLDVRDYGKAEVLEGQLQELKQEQERHALQALAAQQAEECAYHQAAFTQAQQELLMRWQQHMSRLQEHLIQAQQHMMYRHQEETATLLAAQMAVPARQKFSAQLLNMRHIERALVSQKEFGKASKVKRQADHQELLEQQCSDTDRLSRWEAERAALAAQHGREQQAADKKMSSALLEAQLSQQQEMEQLTRRFQAAQLSMSCTHATQQLKAATALQGTLGLAKPSTLLRISSFNTSIAEPRSLVPAPPASPAHACRPGPLFQDTLPPPPATHGQPLVPTLMLGVPSSPGSFTSRPGTSGHIYGGQASGSYLSTRGTSPGRYTQPYGVSRPAGESPFSGVEAWGGGILSSRGVSPGRAMRVMQQAAPAGNRASSPARGMQLPSHTAAGLGSKAPGQLPSQMTPSISSRPCSPAVGLRARSPSPPAAGSRLGTAGQLCRSDLTPGDASAQAAGGSSSSSSSSAGRSVAPGRRLSGKLAPLQQGASPASGQRGDAATLAATAAAAAMGPSNWPHPPSHPRASVTSALQGQQQQQQEGEQGAGEVPPPLAADSSRQPVGLDTQQDSQQQQQLQLLLQEDLQRLGEQPGPQQDQHHGLQAPQQQHEQHTSSTRAWHEQKACEQVL